MEDYKSYFELLGLLVEQFLVSVLVGFVVGKSFLNIGLVFTWITKQFRFIAAHKAICTAFTIYSGYLAFAICEYFLFSGVISVLICGAFMSHYLTYNLSISGSHSSKYSFDNNEGYHLIVSLHM